MFFLTFSAATAKLKTLFDTFMESREDGSDFEGTFITALVCLDPRVIPAADLTLSVHFSAQDVSLLRINGRLFPGAFPSFSSKGNGAEHRQMTNHKTGRKERRTD